MSSKVEMQKRIGELEKMLASRARDNELLRIALYSEQYRNTRFRHHNFTLRRKWRNRLWLRAKRWWRK